MLIDHPVAKPFDANRAGISLGEGAGALCLASKKSITHDWGQAFAFVSGWARQPTAIT